MSILLMVIWLVLWQSAAPLPLISGLLLATLLPQTLVILDEQPSRAKRPGVIIRLFFVVLYDIAVSNLKVARIVLAGREGSIPTGFVNIPLELRDRYGLAVLAAIITATPGTFWAAYNRRTNVLTIHVFELLDEETSRQTIKNRYESPLREIFE
jgi:multicomponent K+:H+ antiporter subunit E